MIITIPVVLMVTNHNDVLWPLFDRVEVKLCKIQNKPFAGVLLFLRILLNSQKYTCVGVSFLIRLKVNFDKIL